MDSFWLKVTLVPFVLVIGYGVIGREEACFEGKFGDAIAAAARVCGVGCSA